MSSSICCSLAQGDEGMVWWLFHLEPVNTHDCDCQYIEILLQTSIQEQWDVDIKVNWYLIFQEECDWSYSLYKQLQFATTYYFHSLHCWMSSEVLYSCYSVANHGARAWVYRLALSYTSTCNCYKSCQFSDQEQLRVTLDTITVSSEYPNNCVFGVSNVTKRSE